jgi:hypothetical protein
MSNTPSAPDAPTINTPSEPVITPARLSLQRILRLKNEANQALASMPDGYQKNRLHEIIDQLARNYELLFSDAVEAERLLPTPPRFTRAEIIAGGLDE